jgi:TonB-dependent starch-binding outer membrane protein SusC
MSPHPSGIFAAILVAGALLLPAHQVAAQQQASVTGQVVGARSGAPISDVQVYLVETQRGVLTGANGRFLIVNVPAGSYQIRAERIGYRTLTQDVTVAGGGATVVDFRLEDEALGLDEIIVTGTAGQARRREVGNSISQLSVADIPSPPSNVDQLLQSQAPGLMVSQGNGSVGGGAQIRLRGSVSVSQSNQPIIYVDGVRVRSQAYARNQQGSFGAGRGNNVTASPLNDINPSDIDRIEVLKGSAASTLYGTEAAAGVIQIFTKRGISGAPRWTLQVDQGFSRLLPFAPDVDVRPPEEWQDPNSADYTGPLGSYTYKYMNMEPYLRNGHRQRYAASVTGGGEALQYFVSGQFDANEGVLPLDQEDKAGLRANFTFSPLQNVTTQVNASYNRTDITGTPAGNNAQGLILNAYRRERNYFNEGNPDSIRKVLDQDITTRIDRFIIGGTVNYDATDNFTNRLTIGYDQAIQDNRNLRRFGYFQAPGGILYTGAHSYETLTLDYTGSYGLDISNDVQITLSGGGQSVTNNERAVRGEAQNFPGPGNPDLDAGTTQLTFENRERTINAGFFGQALFAFQDRYFLTVGARVDGNSAFGEDLGLQAYPKLSASYVISDETFWGDALGDMKLRAAWGESGRAPGTFDAVRTWNALGYGGLPYFSPRNLGNPELGPERTAEVEVGFDWALFDSRLSADFTWYRQTTTDALFNVRTAPSQGVPLTQQENVGKIQNQGIELNLGSTLVDGQNWGFNLDANIYTNASEVLSLGGAPPFSAGGGWVEEGQPVMAARGTTFRNPDNIENPVACTDALDPSRACFAIDQVFGPQQPTLVVGIRPTVRMPLGLELSAMGEYQGGHYINDGTSYNGLSRSIRWPTCADYYALADNGNRDQTTALQRFTCEASILRAPFQRPADYFKIRNVTLQVPLGELIPRSSNSTLTLSAQNFYRWRNADFPMFDPEMVANTGFDNQNASITEHIPPPASFIASLRISF